MQIGLGCMRLSTAPDRDEDRAVGVIHAALDAGVTLLDTADAYATGPADIGHNERLVARALASYSGDTHGIDVATKGGLTRPGGRWVPDGRAKHLKAACEASAVALGVDAIDLYLLHTPDPRTPLATSVRALARLQQAGLVRAIGLCNVTAGQIAQACEIAPIAAVQVALSPFEDEAVRGGVVEACRERGIRLLAHSPLGGPRRRAAMTRDPALVEVAERHGVTPAEVALAWLADVVPDAVCLPGATRVETARSLGNVADIALSDHDRAALDGRFAAADQLRRPRSARRPKADGDGEVVLIMGSPGAGKSTRARAHVERGYLRLNRDEQGGTLKGLALKLDEALAAGRRRVVLDNTYARRSARNLVVETAWRHGVPAHLVWLQTTPEQAQVNAVHRILERYDRLPDVEELAELAKRDPAALSPRALQNYRRDLEPPTPAEGFERLDAVAFERDPVQPTGAAAVVIEIEGVLRRSRSGRPAPTSIDDCEVLTDRGAALQAHVAAGATIIGLSWQPDIAAGTITRDEVDALVQHLCTSLGVEIDVRHCPHGPGPAVCWCRKPLPGLVLAAIRDRGIDAAATTLVGRSRVDRALAQQLGLTYVADRDFFGS